MMALSLPSQMCSPVRRPAITADFVRHLAKTFYKFEEIIELKELESYSDRNFYVRGRRRERLSAETLTTNAESIQQYVLKVLNSADSVEGEFVDAENDAIEFLRRKGFPCPLLLPVQHTCELKVLVEIPLSNDSNNSGFVSSTEECIVRLMTFLPGVTASSLEAFTDKNLFCIGEFVGRVSKTLQGFKSLSLRQKSDKWGMENLLSLTPYVDSVEGEDNRNLVRQVLDAYSSLVSPWLPLCRRGTIHNDITKNNILVDTSSRQSELNISGLVDFGDIRYSFLLSELANTLVGFISEDRAVLDSGYILAGYQSSFPLPCLELDLLYFFVAARLCQVYVITSEYMTSKDNVNNKYLGRLLFNHRALLIAWWSCSKDKVLEAWRTAESNIRQSEQQ